MNKFEWIGNQITTRKELWDKICDVYCSNAKYEVVTIARLWIECKKLNKAILVELSAPTKNFVSLELEENDDFLLDTFLVSNIGDIDYSMYFGSIGIDIEDVSNSLNTFVDYIYRFADYKSQKITSLVDCGIAKDFTLNCPSREIETEICKVA